MKPTDMLNLRKPGEPDRGDCLRACVASIMELDPTTLPNFADDWPGSWLGWAHSRNLLAVEYSEAPAGYCIAVGPSPRFEGTHACVALDGKIVHDPHPSRAGVPSVLYWWRIEPMAALGPGAAGESGTNG